MADYISTQLLTTSVNIEAKHIQGDIGAVGVVSSSFKT